MISKTSSSDWANERCLLIVCFIWVSIFSISRDSCSINRAFCFVLFCFVLFCFAGEEVSEEEENIKVLFECEAEDDILGVIFK